MDNPHQARIDELTNSFCETLKLECTKLCLSGGIDIKDFDPESSSLAKILLTAAIIRYQSPYYLSPAQEEHIKNLVSM